MNHGRIICLILNGKKRSQIIIIDKIYKGVIVLIVTSWCMTKKFIVLPDFTCKMCRSCVFRWKTFSRSKTYRWRIGCSLINKSGDIWPFMKHMYWVDTLFLTETNTFFIIIIKYLTRKLSIKRQTHLKIREIFSGKELTSWYVMCLSSIQLLESFHVTWLWR